jgi:hypothetical protein
MNPQKGHGNTTASTSTAIKGSGKKIIPSTRKKRQQQKEGVTQTVVRGETEDGGNTQSSNKQTSPLPKRSVVAREVKDNRNERNENKKRRRCERDIQGEGERDREEKKHK